MKALQNFHGLLQSSHSYPGPCRHPCQHEAGTGTQLFVGRESQVSIFLGMIFGQVNPFLSVARAYLSIHLRQMRHRGIGIGLHPARGMVPAAVFLEVVQDILPPLRGGLACRDYRAPVAATDVVGEFSSRFGQFLRTSSFVA